VTEHARYESQEEEAIREALASGRAAECPKCAVTMTERAIGGGSFGLGYARRRQWFICPKCHRSAIFDVKRGTRN
jgi:transposase-like protein